MLPGFGDKNAFAGICTHSEYFIVCPHRSDSGQLAAVADVVVCQTERFEASCERDDEMIVMVSSAYGRMELTRCVQSDYGFIGCSADVLEVLDSSCSGRRRCNVGVPSAALEKLAAVACPRDLKLYLAASYRCIPGKCRHIRKKYCDSFCSLL